MTTKQEHARPVVAIGGVVIRGGRVLLVRRGEAPAKGTWSLPGGVLEHGETLREGVVRELAEETGLTVEVLRLIDVAERIFDANGARRGRSGNAERRLHFVILDYLCAARQGMARAGSDAAEVAWARERDLAKFNLHPEVRRILRMAFRMARHRAG